MKSRQKSWRRFNDLIPEKGTSSLRENLKSMRNDNQIKNKHTLKKSNIPKDPVLGLMQLQVWARLDCAEEEFTKMFLVSELQWLLWAFGNNVKTDKKKKNLTYTQVKRYSKVYEKINRCIRLGERFTCLPRCQNGS